MKRLIPIILTLLLLLSACGGEDVTETTPNATQQPTSSITGPEGILEEKETETVYKLAKMTVMGETGEVRWYREYVYDENGFCMEEHETNNFGEMTYRRANTPDDQGRTAESHITEFGGRSYTIKYTYDENSRVTREETWENGAITDYTQYTYDEHGNYLTLQQYVGGEVTMDCSFRYTYDENGHQTSMEELLFGELNYRVEMTYNEEGKEISSVTTLSGGEIQSRTESTWDGLTETRNYYFGSETEAYMTSVVTYDTTGNVVFEQTRYGSEVTSMTEYVYEPFEVKK